MTALPADIAKYTVDGVVLTNENAALRAAHNEAVDLIDNPIEMFYVSVADGQAMLDEKFALRSAINAIHEAVEVDENLRLGSVIPVAPNVPCVRIVDATRNIDTTARIRAYSYETELDRFSVEVIG